MTQNQPILDWSRTDWGKARRGLKSLDITPSTQCVTFVVLEQWFDSHATRLRGVLAEHTPRKFLSPSSKPWWSVSLSHLRKVFHSKARAHRKRPTPTLASEARSAKSAYFGAVNRAKHSYWRQFLVGADHQTVWKAKRLAGNRTPTRFPALPGPTTPESTRDKLIEHFFPSQHQQMQNSVCPAYGDCPPVTKEEISWVLAWSSPSSAPGPNTIPYAVWKKLHLLHLTILPALTGPLVARGYHPKSLKKAEGIVLDKLGKADYDTLASYRLIVLLETLSKIVERLIANRLAAQATELDLLHSNQCGSVAGVSAFHVVSSLKYEVVVAQKLRLKASTLFLDIKGGFDNIRPAALTGYLRERDISPYIVTWVRSFLSNRSCRLAFQGAPRSFTKVAVGTPQGSPICPLLFVLYVAPLHRGGHTQNTFSFVDHFALTSMATSHRRNVQVLQARYRTLARRASRLGLAFSVPKMEIIHWWTPKDRFP